MTSLPDDLQRWEAGEITLNELMAAHPGEDLQPLVALHRALSSPIEASPIDPDPAWIALERQLPAQAGQRILGTRRGVARLAIAAAFAAMAAMFLGSPVGEPLREQVVRLVRTINPFDQPPTPPSQDETPRPTVEPVEGHQQEPPSEVGPQPGDEGGSGGGRGEDASDGPSESSGDGEGDDLREQEAVPSGRGTSGDSDGSGDDGAQPEQSDESGGADRSTHEPAPESDDGDGSAPDEADESDDDDSSPRME